MTVPKNTYVGRRYIPKLFHNPNDNSATWTNSVQHESLTIVMWQGASYTSKQDVPVGIDISDIRYWTRSADYNAQISIYEQNVRDYHQYVIDQIGIINDDNETFKNNVNNDFINYKNDVNNNIDDFKVDVNNTINKITQFYTPEMFGVTGTNDDTAVIQTMLNYINTHNYDVGATIFFGKQKYIFNECIIRTPNLRITGSGLLDGQFTVQSVDVLTPTVFNILNMNVIFDGLNFKSASRKNFAIKLRHLRDATINNCNIENYVNGILGETESNFKWQRTARVKITNNIFRNCDYMVQTQQTPNDGTDINYVYNQHGDYIIQGNYFYTCDGGITSLLLNGQDGLICKGNFFFHGYSGTKDCIEINDSNYVVIEGNNFFESARHGIKADRIRNMIINSNNITLSGRREVGCAIYMQCSWDSLTSSINTIIDNNNITGTTNHAIYLGDNLIKVKISNNTISSVGTSAKYFDGTGIPNPIYDIYVNDGALLGTDAEGIYNKETIIMNGNCGEKGTYNNRGQNFNYFRTDYMKAKKFFGNMIYGLTLSGVVDFNVVVPRGSSPFNPSFPMLFKNATGTLSDITNTNFGQIIIITAGSSGLSITNSSAIVLKGASNLTLTSGQTITLFRTDSNWIQI
jgi:hypothetical protein